MSRLIRVSGDLFDFIGTRTEDGRKLSYEWGEPDADGVYEPTITATDDGARVVTEATLTEGLKDPVVVRFMVGNEEVRRTVAETILERAAVRLPVVELSR